MTDVTISATRTNIEQLVRLLGATSEHDDPCVFMYATTTDGQHDEPATVYRAYLHLQDLQKTGEEIGEEWNPEDHPELLVEDDDGDYRAIDSYDTDADKATAKRIVAYLTKRFDL